MWEIDLNSQIQTFLLSLLIGVGFCIVFDVLNILEEKLALSKNAIFIADILLFICFAFFEFCFFLATENGEIRGFVFIGEIIGFFLCKRTLAMVYVPLILLILKAIKWLFNKVYRISVQPVFKFFSKLRKKILKISQKRREIIKKSWKNINR